MGKYGDIYQLIYPSHLGCLTLKFFIFFKSRIISIRNNFSLAVISLDLETEVIEVE